MIYAIWHYYRVLWKSIMSPERGNPPSPPPIAEISDKYFLKLWASVFGSLADSDICQWKNRKLIDWLSKVDYSIEW